MSGGGLTKWRPSFFIFSAGALILVCLRTVLEIFCTDAETGFYNTDSILIVIFYATYAAFLLALLLAALSGKEALESKPLPRLAGIGWAAGLWGAATGYKAVTDGIELYRLFAERGAGEAAAGFSFKLVLVLTSAASCIVIITLAVRMGMGALKGYYSSAALAVIILQRCCVLAESFTSHTAPLDQPDAVLQLIMLIFSVMFAMGHARVITRMNIGRGHVLTEFAGCACALCILTLWVPPLIAELGWGVAAEKNSATLLCDAALMLYCVLFTTRVTKKL